MNKYALSLFSVSLLLLSAATLDASRCTIYLDKGRFLHYKNVVEVTEWQNAENKGYTIVFYNGNGEIIASVNGASIAGACTDTDLDHNYLFSTVTEKEFQEYEKAFKALRESKMAINK